MTATYSTNLRLIEQGTGDNSGTWGADLNTGMIALIDTAVSGITSISTTGGTYTMTPQDGVADDTRSAILEVTGVLASNATILAPSGVSKTYIVSNATTGSHTLTMSVGGGTITISQGSVSLCYTDGTNFYSVGNNGGLEGNATGNIYMGGFLFDDPLVQAYEEVYNPIGNVSGSINLTYGNGNVQSLTLTGDTVITLAGWPASGKSGSMMLRVTQNGTGGYALTFAGGSTVVVPGGGGLVLTGTAGSTDLVMFESDNGGTTLYMAVLKNFQ